MESTPFRKARQWFDTAVHPHHVSFDDGKSRRVLPWSHFVEARWSHVDPVVIELTIAEWLILLGGHNLAPLLTAIEEQTLLRVVAHPEWDRDSSREQDTFATSIRILKSPSLGFAQTRQPAQLELPINRSTARTDESGADTA